MIATFPHAKTAFVSTLLLILLTGCGRSTVSRSSLSTTIGTRSVKATLDGPGSITNLGDTVIVTFSGGKLAIDKDRVLLDGKELGTLPEGAKTITVDYSNGTLSVAADGVPVSTGKVQK